VIRRLFVFYWIAPLFRETGITCGISFLFISIFPDIPAILVLIFYSFQIATVNLSGEIAYFSGHFLIIGCLVHYAFEAEGSYRIFADGEFTIALPIRQSYNVNRGEKNQKLSHQ
jgi:hypothetical protein